MRTQRGPRTTESGAARRPREVVQLRCCCFAVRSAAVAVGVARQGALDVVPAVAHRVAGVVPGQARVVFGTALLPVPLQVGLDLLEPAAAVLAIGVVAVLVGRAVIVPVAVGVVVGRVAVLTLEVVAVLGRVHRLGDRITRLGADHPAGNRADRTADRAAGRTDGGPGNRAGDGAAASANAVVLLHVVHQVAPVGEWGRIRSGTPCSTGRGTTRVKAGAGAFSRSGVR